MPLHDHFHRPVSDLLPWETMHTGWAAAIAVHLNTHWLGDDFVALEESRPGNDTRIEIATYEIPARGMNGAVATVTTTWAPPAALATTPSVIPDHTEIRILRQRGGRRLVAAIELISPGNEDDPVARTGFVGKCVALLQAGVCVVIVDVVTECHFNLHNLIVAALHAPDTARLPAASHLYAAAYRPVLRDGRQDIDIWAAECAVGRELPTMPMRLTADHFIPVEFEATYAETCRTRKLA